MEQIFYIPPSMVWPLASCLVLTGIHVYLGVHVIARKVIFVDLALAQIAALGTVTGVLLGYEVGKDIMPLYLYSLAFTIFGAFIFSATRMKGEKVPHEAIIGIVYAVTFAITILVLSRSPLGPQELDHIIKGELLWVQAPTVIKTAIIYACVGIFHFAFRKKFMSISLDPHHAEESGMNVRFWDFLFYMSFGFVITSSVAIAGVFLVFSYLVIPSVGAMLFSEKLSTRLAIGWIGGAIISFIGVKLSWTTGLPTSPLIVVIFAAALIISGVIRYLRVSESKVKAVRNLALSACVFAFFVGMVFFFRKPEEDPLTHTLNMLKSPLSTDRTTAIVNLEEHMDKKDEWIAALVASVNDVDADVRASAVKLLVKVKETSALPQIEKLLTDKSDDVRNDAIDAVAAMGGPADGTLLLQSAAKEDDPEMKISILGGALLTGDADAIPQLLTAMKENEIFADEAYAKLQPHIAFEFKSTESDKAQRWYEDNKGKLKWDGAAKMFRVD
jgi:zinc/manganese transport system permease protein